VSLISLAAGGTPAGGFNWDEWFTTHHPVECPVDNLDDLMGGSFSEFFRRIFGGAPDYGNIPQGRASNRAPRGSRRLNSP